MTQQERQVAVLAEAGLRELKAMQRILTQAGVDSAIIRPPRAGGG